MRPINASTVETIVEDSIFHFLVFRFGEEKKKKKIDPFVRKIYAKLRAKFI